MSTRLEAITDITTSTNVRTNLGDIADLAKSIEAVGLLNPITVRELDDGTVELVAGHRRLEAVRRLGWDSVDVYVITSDDDHRLATQLVENLQRENLTPLEEAAGLAELVEQLGSATAAAKAVGRSKAHVSKRLALTKLPAKAAELVDDGTINLEQAVDISKLDESAATKVAESFASVHPATAQFNLEKALDDQKRAKRRDALIRELNQAGDGPPALATMPDGGRTLEGYEGLPVDFDEHLAEPCARLRVRYNTWDSEPRTEQICAEPDRHKPGGDSPVRLLTDDEETREAQRQADRLREHEERRQATERRAGEAARAAKALTDRNAALRGLALAVIATASFEHLVEAIELVAGIDILELVGERPEPSWSEEARVWYESIEELPITSDKLTAADTYRIAAYIALREHGPAGDHTPHENDGATSQALVELFGVDLNTIHGRTRGTTNQKESTE